MSAHSRERIGAGVSDPALFAAPIAQLHSRIACVFRRIFISTFPSSHHVAASIGWSLATPLAEQGTGRTRRAVGGAQVRGMVRRGAFQALPNTGCGFTVAPEVAGWPRISG